MDLNSLNGLLRRLLTHTQKLKTAQQNGDLSNGHTSLMELERDLAHLTTHWIPTYQALQQEWQEQHRHLGDPDYIHSLEASLAALGIPWQGSFPNYDLLPLKLSISLDPPSASLTLGRKLWQKTTALAPGILGKWVQKHYQTLLKRPFRSDHFSQELLSAYECLNRLHNQSQTVKWGQSVSLLDIYELLTLRVSTRQDYSKVLFAFDLSQWRQHGQISYKGHRLELAAVRDPSGNLVLMSRQGQEERVGSLTIYRE